MQLHDVFLMPLGLFLSRGIHCLKLVLQEFKMWGEWFSVRLLFLSHEKQEKKWRF